LEYYCACKVYLLGHSDLLHEVEDVIKCMLCEPHAAAWIMGFAKYIMEMWRWRGTCYQ